MTTWLLFDWNSYRICFSGLVTVSSHLALQSLQKLWTSLRRLRDIQGPSFVQAYGTLVSSFSYCETYGPVRDMLRVVWGRFEGRPHEQHLLLSPRSETTQHGCKLDMCVCHRPSVAHLSIVRVTGTSGRRYVCFWACLSKPIEGAKERGCTLSISQGTAAVAMTAMIVNLWHRVLTKRDMTLRHEIKGIPCYSNSMLIRVLVKVNQSQPQQRYTTSNATAGTTTYKVWQW